MAERTAVVTGAAGTIGSAITERLLRDGHRLVLADVRPEAARHVAEQLDPAGERTRCVAVDVYSPGIAAPSRSSTRNDSSTSMPPVVNVIPARTAIARIGVEEEPVRFSERVAIVTGGASGIGLAVATQFVAEGAAVVIADRDEARGEAAAGGIAASGAGARVRYVRTDVSDGRAVDALVGATVAAFGRLDVMVNNAGVEVDERPDGPATEADWDHLFDINTKGTWFGCRAALPHLIETKGAIVNNASVAALVGSPGHVAYSASKAAVVNLTKTLALTYAEQGVRINAICPGPILTEMTRAAWESDGGDEGRRRNLALCPARRAADAVEVAALVLYLASSEAAFITGAAIPIDGGKSAGLMTSDRYRW